VAIGRSLRGTLCALVLAGCGPSDRELYLEKELARLREELSKGQKELSDSRHERDDREATSKTTEEQLEAKLARSQDLWKLAEGRAENLQAELSISHLLSTSSRDAFMRGMHIYKEFAEVKEKSEERAKWVKLYWEGELADVGRVRTLEDMVAICRALGHYRLEHERYPPSGSKELWKCLASARKYTGEPYLHPREGTVSKEGELLDVWGHPYAYVENLSRDLPEIFPNRRTYLLYSLGPNGKDETAPGYAPGGDDVCNWGRY
jgi:hypothetical protein